MPSDFKVRWLSEEDVAQNAAKLRDLARVQQRQSTFDVVDVLHHVVIPSLAKVGKRFVVEVFDEPSEDPAWVDFETMTVHVASHIVSGARAGHPYSRLVLAHEIGHMIFHHDQVMAFSSGKEQQLRSIENEYSAEWQANTFALHLLLPDVVIERHYKMSDNAIAYLTEVDERLVTSRRYDLERRKKYRLRQYTGDQCLTCSNFSIYADGVSLACDSCGPLSSI